MNGISEIQHRTARICDEPIEKFGLTLYPVTMRDYEAYAACKRAILLRQRTLPASYISMAYLEALFAVDADNGFQIGLMSDVITLLALATRTSPEAFRVNVHVNDPKRLSSISYNDGTMVFRITPVQFSTIRMTIAEQNGDKLPDESENPELLQAEADIAAASGMELDYDYETMIASVACQYRTRQKDLMDWTIREFESARRAIERDKRHTICTLAENMGTKYKSGNPFPSWCFDRKRNGSAALEPLNAFTQRAGISQNAIQPNNP